MAAISGLPSSASLNSGTDGGNEFDTGTLTLGKSAVVTGGNHTNGTSNGTMAQGDSSDRSGSNGHMSTSASRQCSSNTDPDSNTNNFNAGELETVVETEVNSLLQSGPNMDSNGHCNEQTAGDSNQSQLQDHIFDLLSPDQLQETGSEAAVEPAVCGVSMRVTSPRSTPKKVTNKSAKRSSDRKRKGSSWYSVLSPTYKSRSEDFKRIFKDLPHNERLIVDYSCALQKDILVQGRLYISREWICFYANIFRWETVLTIRCKDITRISKEKTARVIPNAIQIVAKDERYFFTSFGARDKTFMVLDNVWKSAQNNQVMSQRDLWQWIHYSYGEDLGLTSDDDIDYVCISSKDKIEFQMRIQQEEKLADPNFDNLDSLVTKEPADDYILGNGQLNHLIVPPFASGTDVDNVSLLSCEDISDARYPWPGHGQDLVSDEGVIVSPDGNASDCYVSTDVEDSSEDEEDRPCSGHTHYSIPVVDELLNIPIDTVFEHCFTDSPLYRDFVKNKKTLDVMLSPWPDEADSSGIKVRNIAYTLTLNYSIGPKHSPSTERQIMYPESRPGEFYLIDTECVNGGIPYGENFYVVNRFCIARVSSTKSRLRITSQIKYRKSVWGIVKNFIEKNAAAGIIESFNVMAELLRQESSRQAQLALSAQPSLPRKRVLRRRRVSERCAVKRPSVVDTPHHSTSKHSTPVKHVQMLKGVGVKTEEQWFLKLSSTGLIRGVCTVLILLMVFNAFLLYKLWSLEARTTLELLSRKQHQSRLHLHHTDSFKRPLAGAGGGGSWSDLLDQQKLLHETEIERWKAVLSSTIQLMDHMVQTLSELRSTIDPALNDADNSTQPSFSSSDSSSGGGSSISQQQP